jgi:Fe-Mn family superoxide dismutase
MSIYTLPDLPYDFAALEPHLSGRILELHHGKHHAAYVQGANTALEKLDEARRKGEFASVAALERALAFNLSGHVLHSLFWTNMTPKGGGRPGAELGAVLERDFGGFEPFKRQFIETAATIMGSGWAALVWEPLAGRLLVTQIFDHQANVAQGSLPIMVLDAWEHAYYLQYQNRKTEFFEAVWNVWNWGEIERRFKVAKTV